MAESSWSSSRSQGIYSLDEPNLKMLFRELNPLNAISYNKLSIQDWTLNVAHIHSFLRDLVRHGYTSFD